MMPQESETERDPSLRLRKTPGRITICYASWHLNKFSDDITMVGAFLRLFYRWCTVYVDVDYR